MTIAICVAAGIVEPLSSWEGIGHKVANSWLDAQYWSTGFCWARSWSRGYV
jgi:hypothetical protein